MVAEVIGLERERWESSLRLGESKGCITAMDICSALHVQGIIVRWGIC